MRHDRLRVSRTTPALAGVYAVLLVAALSNGCGPGGGGDAGGDAGADARAEVSTGAEASIEDGGVDGGAPDASRDGGVGEVLDGETSDAAIGDDESADAAEMSRDEAAEIDAPRDVHATDVVHLDAPVTDATDATDAASDTASHDEGDAGSAAPDALPPCPPGTERCPGALVCNDLATDALNCGVCGRTCGGGRACVMGLCACQAGQIECGGRCIDPRDDRANCGMCGRSCPGALRCEAGVCGCAGALRACGDACVDTTNDRAHCGACGVACGVGQSCVDGACRCAAGQTACGTGASSACVDTRADRANCGACGHACASEQLCEDGACRCPMGQTLCSGRCVSTQTNSAHCGACDTACPSGQLCNGGVCGLSCTGGRTACGAGAAMTCADLSADDQHCGACATRCDPVANASLAICSSGACVPACNPGFANCDRAYANGCEANTQSSVNHCGGCGAACPSSAPFATAVTCTSGACRPTCAADRGDCDAVTSNGCEVDLQSSSLHCGACNNACAAGHVCVGGVCSAPSCRTLLAQNPAAPSGLYPIDPDGAGPLAAVQLYCDMSSFGGGWTLVQRTTSNWTETRALLTNEASARDTTVGSPADMHAFRLALRYWPALQSSAYEHLLRYVGSTREGPDCQPLHYRLRGARWIVDATGPMFVDLLPGVSGATSIVNAYRSATHLRFNALDDGTDYGRGCVQGNNGIPWMYEAACCNFCPTFSYFGVPRPMTNLVRSPDELGREIYTPGVCPAGTTPMSDRPTNDGYFGGSNAEVYLR